MREERMKKGRCWESLLNENDKKRVRASEKHRGVQKIKEEELRNREGRYTEAPGGSEFFGESKKGGRNENTELPSGRLCSENNNIERQKSEKQRKSF